MGLLELPYSLAFTHPASRLDVQVLPNQSE
jgi:hypothetical protein